MIIAVEGVSCTGKSTLATSLAGLLTCEVIGCYYHVADDPLVLGEPLAASENEQLASLTAHLVIEKERKRRAQDALMARGSVVIDRSVDTLLAHLNAVGRIQGLDIMTQARALVHQQIAAGAAVLPDLTLILIAGPQALASRATSRPDLPTLYYNPIFTTHFNHYFADPISPRCVWLNANHQPALATSRFVLSRTPPSQAAVLFYPPFRQNQGPMATSEGDLLMVNPVPAKGAELVHRLAELLPDRRFTLVEGWWNTSQQFAHHPNVTYLPRTYDMESLYRQHQLLLVPSVVEDAFPRVIVEAGLAGLPAIGSRQGGIPEAITDPRLLAPHDNPGAWTSLIHVLTPERAKPLAEAARRRALPMTRPCLPELAAAGIIP